VIVSATGAVEAGGVVVGGDRQQAGALQLRHGTPTTAVAPKVVTRPLPLCAPVIVAPVDPGRPRRRRSRGDRRLAVSWTVAMAC
jgi:hypothetical protein